MDAFQADAFQATAFQAGGSSGNASAFQCGAFQSTAFQTCGGNVGNRPAFQCGAFQLDAFQTCKPAPVAPLMGGGFVRHPFRKPRFAPVVLSPEELTAERVRAGVIPAPVKRVVKQVARRALDDLNKSQRTVEAELRAELLQREIAYEQAYTHALEQERERLVTAEIRRLMARQAEQQAMEREANTSARLVALRRQIEQFRQHDEQALELLLLYS